MQVAKWGNSLAVRIPKAVVDEMKLKEGDDVHIRWTGDREFELTRDDSREQAIERIRKLAKPLPPGWKFDRDEANAR